MLSLDDRLPRNKNSAQAYVHPGAYKETVDVAKARKMPRTYSDLQRGSDLRKCQRSRSHDSAKQKTYSASKTWCERDPGNEPRRYSSPVRAVLVVAIAAA
jgi:hypothetical protein